MHKSCKKHSRLFLSAPSLTKTYLFFFFDLKPAIAPSPLSLPLNDIFSKKISVLGVEYWIQFWTTL